MKLRFLPLEGDDKNKKFMHYVSNGETSKTPECPLKNLGLDSIKVNLFHSRLLGQLRTIHLN